MEQEVERDAALDREIATMDYEASIQRSAERLRFQQETGLAAIKSLMFANGGAILALLTFIGNDSGAFDASSLRRAFGAFCLGLTFTLLSYLGAYFSQAWFSNSDTSIAWNYQKDMKSEPRSHDYELEMGRGHGFLIFAIACIFSSLACFGYGAFAALNGIL